MRRVKRAKPIDWLLLPGLVGTLVVCPAVPGEQQTPALARALVVATRGNSLEFSLTVAASEFHAGEPVEARLAVENIGDAPVTLGDVPFRIFDLTVYDARGVKIWAWSETRPPVPLGIPGFRRLDRAQIWGDTLVWDQRLAAGRAGRPPNPAPRGRYLLEGLFHATFPGDGAPVVFTTPRLAIVLGN